MIGAHVDEGRRAGTAVEMLVGASDREIGADFLDRQIERADRMREIPHDGDSLRVRGRGDAGHVVHSPGAVIDLGEQQHGDVRAERGFDGVGRREAQEPPSPAQGRQRVRHVEVGRKIAVVAEDDPSL